MTLWPPSGLTLALLLLTATARWPAILVGALLGSVASDLLSRYSIPLAVFAAAANIVESLLAACALRAVMRAPVALTVTGVVAFTLVAAVLSNAVTAVLGALVLLVGFHSPALLGWFVWWAGDGLGMLIVTPPILAWAAAWHARLRLSRVEQVEVAVLTALLAATAVAVLGPPQRLPIQIGPYAVLPFLFWAALRFGTLGAATESLVLAGVATWFASQRLGPFVQPGAAQWTAALQMYVYLAVASLSALIFGAGIEERRAADIRLLQSEERLRDAQKLEAIGKLAGGIAHDFNNVLTVIHGNCDLLSDAMPKDGQAARDIGEIRAAAQRAAALTHQLLAFSRRQTLAPRELRLQEVIATLMPMLQRLIGVHITIETGASTAAPIVADRSQLEQVIVNLSVNARDAMPEGGRLRFDVSDVDVNDHLARRLELSPGPYVRLDVSDTGTGIDEATIPRVFEPFFTTKAEGRGTGLGLSTVHGIIKQSNGGLELRSARGRGTTFMLYFPRAFEAA